VKILIEQLNFVELEKTCLCIFPMIGGITMADERPDSNTDLMVGFLLLTPKSNGSCTKQIHKVNLMSSYVTNQETENKDT
jgi:hypothetical protein